LDEGDRTLYRRALGAFATGVCVVSVDAPGAGTPGGVAGLTVNSFTSVSLDPPLVVWCLGEASDRGVWFRGAERFTINVMGAEDEALARECARRGQYALPPHRLDLSRPGQPAVTGALARLFCRRHDAIALGDHLVIVGEVMGFDTRDGDGLTYFRGRFGAASDRSEA
jgi:flavin reductase (DIM6/NTAB) family NADH-FMN oxidoreductase RutF